MNEGIFLLIHELLIIDFVRTDKFILIRPNYKFILFSGGADNHNIIIQNLGVHVTVVSGVSHKEHTLYDSRLRFY